MAILHKGNRFDPEQLFRLTFENAAVGMTQVDPPGRYISVNQKMAEITGYSKEELLQKTFQEITHPDDLEEDLRQADMLRRGEINSYSIEKRYLKKNGNIVWVDLTVSAVTDENGNLIFIIGVVEDISKRKQAEEALRKSEEKYHTLFESIDEGFGICEMIFDENGKPSDYRWLEINPSWEKQTGLKNPVGRTALELVPDLEQHWIDIYGKVVLTSEPVRFQQGSEAIGRWFDVYSFSIGKPQLYQFGILFTDITARIKTEEIFRQKVEELKVSEEKFRTLANNISQLAWMADNVGKIIWINKRWIDYTGKSPHEIEGYGWKKIIHPEHMKRLAETVSFAIKNEEPWDEFVPLKNKAGGYKWFLFRVIPVWDEIANSLRWFGTATDITKQREIEDLLKKDKELVENLLYIAAHDLKGPVANMYGFFEVMEKMEPKQKLKMLEHFKEMADQLDKTIKSITDILRVRDTDKSSASLVYFKNVVNDILLEYRDKLPTSAINLDIKEKSAIRYIEPLLYSVIKNLISNSIKYSRDDVPLHIKISTQKEKNYTLLAVNDNGIGIDMNKYGEKIFSPFQRFEVDKATGTGIGLYLIKSIIEKNGGYINVESTPGKGTTFYCYLKEY